MDRHLVCPLDHLSTPETAADDVVTIASHFIAHPAPGDTRSALGWVLLAAEIVDRMTGVSYTRFEIQAKIDDKSGNRQLSASMKFIQVAGVMLRVDTNTGNPRITRCNFAQANEVVCSSGIFKPCDNPAVTICMDAEKLRDDQRPAWLPALVSNWGMKSLTPSPKDHGMAHPTPRF